MSPPEIGPTNDPKIEISKKYSMRFPGFTNNLLAIRVKKTILK